MKMFKRTCVLLIVAATALSGLPGCSDTPKHESTGQYIDNSALTSKIKASILRNYPSSYTQVSVESYKGTVQLSGFVSSKKDLDGVVDLVSNMPGVTKVENDLYVKK